MIAGPDALYHIGRAEEAFLHFRIKIPFVPRTTVHERPESAEKCARRIQAESFDLVADGKIKAQLRYGDSETSLTFNNEKGYRRLAVGTIFGVPFGGPYLEMFPGDNQSEMNPHMNHEKGLKSLESRH